jgi:putative ABC transport system permease protein
MVSFSLSDIAQAKQDCPAVDYGYAAVWERFVIGESRRPRPERVVRKEDGSIVVHEEDPEAAEDPGQVPERAAVEEFSARGVTVDYFSSYGLQAEYGSLFTAEDVRRELKLIVVGSELAGKLYPQQRAADIVGKRIQLNSVGYTIIGILEKIPEDNPISVSLNGAAMVPVTATQSYLYTNSIHTLSFSVEDPEDLDEAVGQLEAFFSMKYGDKVSITNRRAEYVEQRRRIIPLLTVIGLLSSMGLFIASINILNLMLARVVRRQKAIGISTALGASRKAVFKQYMTESLGLGIIGGIVGIGLSLVLLRIFRLIFQISGPGGQSAGPELNLSLTTIGLALGITLVVNLIFAVYPAYKASSVDPADALRT